jgi:hypothetical protein
MAIGKFLSGLLGKNAANEEVKKPASDSATPFTTESVFGELVESIENSKVQVEPVPEATRKPVSVLPSYIPSQGEEESLRRRINEPMVIRSDGDPVDADAPTNVDSLLDPLAGFGGGGPKSKVTPWPETPIPDRLDAWPETPQVDVRPEILRLDKRFPASPEADTEPDSDIFYPVGHPGLNPPTPNPDGPGMSREARGAMASQVSAVSGLPPVPPEKKAASLGAAHKVGWGLRLAAKLAAANRTPTPSPDYMRVRVPRRAMSDSELIPPLYFRKSRRTGE